LNTQAVTFVPSARHAAGSRLDFLHIKKLRFSSPQYSGISFATAFSVDELFKTPPLMM
jgi:hypothetical protein